MVEIAKEIIMVKVSELKPSEYNPRQFSDKQKDDLKTSLEKFGQVDPIIVNKAVGRENVVIGGHFRLKVMQELSWEEAGVVYVDIPDVAVEKELNLRLNKNTGSWDMELLASFEMDFLKEVGFSEFDYGFIDKEIEGIKNELDKLPVEKRVSDMNKYDWLWIEFKDNANMILAQKVFCGGKGREMGEDMFMEAVRLYAEAHPEPKEETPAEGVEE